MGRRGPRPKPTALKELEGNRGKRKLNKNEPKPKIGLPDPPAELTEKARGVWHRLGARLLELGLVSDLDEPALAMYCQAYSNWLELIELAKIDGPLVEINGMPMPNPALSRADKEAAACRKLLQEFGGSPASRARLTVEKPPTPTDDLETFLKIA